MKKLVIITGMHRSGTSLTARISQCMGAYLGEDNELIGSSLGNPDGHFENIEAVCINNNILQLCDRQWYSLESPEVDYQSLQIRKSMDNIKAVVRKLMEKNNIAVIKDPRISVLLPLWEKALKGLGIEVFYIWVYRNPLEVMESLRERNGYSSKYGLLLWIHYNLSILRFVKGKEYLLINYRDILEQSSLIKKLSAMFCCKCDDDLTMKIHSIIKQGYCHFDYSYQDVKYTQNSLLSGLYGALLEKREANADVSLWEKYYKTALNEAEGKFLDYEILENVSVLEGKEIIIYGAGNYGLLAANMLQQLGFPEYNFCDKDIHKHGMNFMNGIVFSIAEIENRENLLIIVAIENEDIRKEMEQTLAYIKGVNFLSFFVLEEIYHYRAEHPTSLMSETEKIYAWYKELENRAEIVRDACQSPVLVYQNGKVGSSTISKSLWNVGVENAHVHRFFFKNDIVGELILGEEQKKFISSSNFFNFQYSEYVMNVKKEMKCKKMITLVREPIAVDLSTVFQWIGSRTSSRYFAQRFRRGESFCQIVSELMVKVQNRMFDWFDEELKELCGIDVFLYSFDKEKGYTIISDKGVEILLLKVEKLSGLAEVIRDFIGIEQFELLNENVGKNKRYAHLYRDIKEKIELPKEYVEHYYSNNQYMDHFYTKEEQKIFLSRWKGIVK